MAQTTTGLRESTTQLTRAIDNVGAALRSVSRNTAYRIRDRARQLVAVATGMTRDRINVVEDEAHQQFWVGVGREATNVLESLGAGRNPMVPVWLEFGTRYMAPRPFMGPATEEAREPHRAAVDATLERIEQGANG
jgi:HK97 gp10 family phage protein